jgi:ribosomal protein S18 acetylase RimI-like enzyme
MINPDAAASAFDAEFARRAPHLGIVPETGHHRRALHDLMIACSPLRNLLPAALLDLQFESQSNSFHSFHPRAMRRIVTHAGQPIARIIIDWEKADVSHGVDIAVHPNHRRSGAALAMLRAWIAVADASGRVATLDVIADNPAKLIYQRLGFIELSAEAGSPHTFMERPRARIVNRSAPMPETDGLRPLGERTRPRT